MRKKQYLCLICGFILFCGGFMSSQTKTIRLGGITGWQPFSTSDGVTFGAGRFGYESVKLASGSKQITPQTDLLLDFEKGKVFDAAGNYTVTSSTIFTSQKALMGAYSGVSRGVSPGIRLQGKSGSLFGSGGLTGSFSVSFWLYPSVAANGEQVLSWRSSRAVRGVPVYQLFTAGIFNSRMEWQFVNMFNSGKTAESRFTLNGRSVIVPETWSRHTLSYDDREGLLEYRVNGRLEALCYVTSDGTETGTVYPGEIGVPAELDICPNYTGLIDDVYISRKSGNDPDFDVFPAAGGHFETQPLKTSGYASQLTGFESSGLNPPQTDVVFYVRGGDNFYEWTDTFPEWVGISNGKPEKEVRGLYFQVAAALYPDGTGSQTPSVSEITLTYLETEPPPPPGVVTVNAGDGYVDISWPASVDSSIEGYLLYYGERPGEYLGRNAQQGVSPINLGKNVRFRLSGLTNGTLYYFAVAATTAGGNIIGPLSKEVYARPLRTAP